MYKNLINFEDIIEIADIVFAIEHLYGIMPLTEGIRDIKIFHQEMEDIAKEIEFNDEFYPL